MDTLDQSPPSPGASARGRTLADQLPRLGEPLQQAHAGFRGSQRRPSTQGGLRPASQQMHGARAPLSARNSQAKSPTRSEEGFMQQPSIWARQLESRGLPETRLSPTSAVHGIGGSKRLIQEWLKSGTSHPGQLPAEREKMASAASSELSRPSTSQQKYTWDSNTYVALKDNLSKGPQPGGLISALLANPAEPDIGCRHADHQAMQWFRDSYPAGVPCSRQDALTARQWLDEQLQQLRRAFASKARTRPDSPPVMQQQARQQLSMVCGWEASLAATTERATSLGADTLTGQLSPSMPAAEGATPLNIMECLKETLTRSRDAAGFMSRQVISHQEEVFSRCMGELCGQVASSCLERGYLMHQLWTALRHMLRAVSADRDLARSLAVESRHKENACVEGMQDATQQLRLENDELTRMTDTLHQRLLIRQAEIEVQKSKVAELQSQLGDLAGVKPELLRQQIADCNANLAAMQKQNVALTVRLERAAADQLQRDKDLQTLTAKLLESQDEAASATAELHCRTPRPSPPEQPPWDLLSEEQTSQCVRALREGCSPEDLHRLLIGVSASGANLLPYWDLLGCCRYLNPSTPGSLEADMNDAEGHNETGLESHLPNVWRNDPGTPGTSRWGTPSKHHPSPLQPEASVTSTQRLPSHSRPVTRDGRDGMSHTMPATRRSGQVSKLLARRTLTSLSPPPVPIKELHTFLNDLLEKHSVPDLMKYLPEAVVQSVCQMLNHGIDIESTTCLLLGCMSFEGVEVTRYKALAGALKAVLRQGPSDIGGPITEALTWAAGSTSERVLQLERSLLLQRRRALKLTHAATEQQQRDDEHGSIEERRRARKLQLRPHPLLAITSLKRPEFFPGLGTSEDVPAVLRYDGKVYRSALDVREAVRSVRAIWAAKAELEASGAPRQLLNDFLFEYMQKKYGRSMVAETMTLLYTASQHQHEPELCLFFKAFLGEVEDTMQEEQARMCDGLLDALTEADAAINQHAAGWLSKADVRACLQQVLSHKSESQLQELMDALDAEEQIALVKYTLLFEENAEGLPSLFAQVLRSQHISERVKFHQAIEDALLDAAERAGVDVIAPSMLSAAISKAHPKLEGNAANNLLVRVFGPDAVQDATVKSKSVVAPVPWEDVVRRLRVVPPDNKPDGEVVLSPVAKSKGKSKGAKGKKK